MRRLTPSDFTAMPWRNGGGVTHEIAQQKDSDGLIWRLSTARVEADTEYSLFPGLTRLSAVVEGVGVRLLDTVSGDVQDVRPSVIAHLSGDRVYRGTLIDGGIRHLNLVFDPKKVSAEMGVGVQPAGGRSDVLTVIYRNGEDVLVFDEREPAPEGTDPGAVTISIRRANENGAPQDAVS